MERDHRVRGPEPERVKEDVKPAKETEDQEQAKAAVAKAEDVVDVAEDEFLQDK